MGMINFLKKMFTRNKQSTPFFDQKTHKNSGTPKKVPKLAKGETLNPKARRVSAKMIRKGLNKGIRDERERGWSK